MHESPTYQAILREGRKQGLIEAHNEGLIEGRVEEAGRILLMLGEDRFGEPGEATRRAVEAIRDVERLERMAMRVHDANLSDWEGLLNTA
jgi:predicted transposase YdaD